MEGVIIGSALLRRGNDAMELLGKSKDELCQLCVSLGEPAYRGEQIYHALYAERKFDIAAMTNLPAPLRERLAAEARVTLPTVRQRYVSKDGSVRYLFALPSVEQNQNKDGLAVESTEETECRPSITVPRLASATRPVRAASVEAVFMPIESRQTI